MQGWNGRIFVVGAGSMAEAFVRGITERRAVASERIQVVNRHRSDRKKLLTDLYGVQAVEGFSEAAGADLIVLAVKPGDVAGALRSLSPYLDGQPILSFAAGVTLSHLRDLVERKSPVIRTMPNIPVAVLAGATAVSFAEEVQPSDRDLVRFLLEQVGKVVEVPEPLMDAATAFSGSGPGFVCYFLEAMENAAVDLGFAPEMARELLLQTVIGTAKTLGEWGLSPRELRERVTSPGGTTHAGISMLQAGNLEGVVKQALRAAKDRSEEMGHQLAANSEA